MAVDNHDLCQDREHALDQELDQDLGQDPIHVIHIVVHFHGQLVCQEKEN